LDGVSPFLWPCEVLESFIEDLRALKEAARVAVVAKLEAMLQGSAKAWRDAQTCSEDLALLAVENTRLSNDAAIVWWVGIDDGGRQMLVLYRLVRLHDLHLARTRARAFLCNFSDEHLHACMMRDRRNGTVFPCATSLLCDTWRSGAVEKVAVQNDSVRPVSLQKRYVMTHRHLDILKMHGMKGVQLPFVLDTDESHALDKVMREPVFLLGRSGSGKTSVLVHAMYYAYISAKDFGYAAGAYYEDQSELDTCGKAEEPLGPILLVTRSPLLANAIKKLFDQMVAGVEQTGSAEGHAAQASRGLELGVLSDEEVARAEKLPETFLKEDVPKDLAPLSASWASVLMMADASIPGDRFFRRGSRTESALQRAQRRQSGKSSGDAILMASDRFPHLQAPDGYYDPQDELTFEVFEKEIAKKLLGPPHGMGPLHKGYNLLGVYTELLSTIAGSRRAVLSPSGSISKEEYVAAGGDPAIYDVFDIYTKAKLQLRMWDRVDPVRHMFRRLRKYKLTLDKREAAWRMPSAVFIDEVQDLLPCELLLLRQFSKQTNCWVFAGDTAQTISKGISFRFDDLRTLYLEEFVLGRDWLEEKKPRARRLLCKMCNTAIGKEGGIFLECHSHYTAHEVHCHHGCFGSFKRVCDDKVKGGTNGVRKKHEWAAARGRLSCPLCGLFMKESQISPQRGEDEDSDDDASTQMQVITDVPAISFLTKNHRSVKGILDFAGTIVDALMFLFPTKIDRLKREVSAVDSDSRPVLLHGFPFEQALELLFPAQGPTGGGAVLEFGAKQAVLVWSESSRQQVKERFPMSIVLTIHDAKGLEFSDVLIMRPFSDMGAQAPLNGGPRLWNLVYWYMRYMDWDTEGIHESRVPPLDCDRDGLLCTWLKVLYVAITRARERVWIYDDCAPEAMIAFCRASKAARTVSSLEQAANEPDLIAGFAQNNSAAEFIDEGQAFLQSQRFPEAMLCFARAAEAGSGVALLWKEHSNAAMLKQQAVNARGASRIKLHVDAANAFLRTATVVAAAAEQPDELQPAGLRILAAECFVEGDRLKEAAEVYESAGCMVKAAEVWEAIREFKRAGDAWLAAGRHEPALRAYARCRAWRQVVVLAEGLVASGRGLGSVENIQETLRMAARNLARMWQDKSSDDTWDVLLRSLKLMPGGRSRMDFVKRLGVMDLVLYLMEREGKHVECAVFALERLNFDLAMHFFGIGRVADEQERISRVQWFRALGLANLTTMELARTPPLHIPAGAPDWLALSKSSVEEIHAPCTSAAETMRGLDKIWRAWESMARVETAGVGHSIGFRMLVVLKFRRLICSYPLKFEMLGKLRAQFEQWANSLSDELEHISSFGSAEGHRPLPWVERAVEELLLVARPPGVHEDVLVLADILPPSVASSRLPYELMTRIARAVAVVWRLRLALEKVQVSMAILDRSRPSWRELDHALQNELHKPQKGFIVRPLGSDAVVREAWTSLQDASRLRGSLASRGALDYLGHAAHGILGEFADPEHLGKLFEGLKSTLLWDACLPQFPMTAVTRSACTEISEPLIRNEMDKLLMTLRHKKRVKLSHLLQGSAPLLWTDRIGYHSVAALSKLINKNWDRDAVHLVRTVEIQQAASPEGQEWGAQMPTYDDLLNFFFASWKVTEAVFEHLLRDETSAAEFPVAPQVVVFLVERVVTWSTVLMTCFTNTTLPTSWVRNHTANHPYLAALAGANYLPTYPRNRRKEVMHIRERVVRVLGKVLEKTDKFTKWVSKYNASHPAMVMRFATAMFVGGSINWLRYSRNDQVNTALNSIGLNKRLELMNVKGGQLPRALQWLIAAPLRDEKYITRDENVRYFDRMTPFLNAVLEQVGDPFVILHRNDTRETAPSWTTGERTLQYHRSDVFQGADKDGLARKVLHAIGHKDGEWPSNQIYVNWARLQVVEVYWAGWSMCDFSDPAFGVGRVKVARPTQSPTATAGGEFVLDKSAQCVEGAVDIHVDEEAALKLSVSDKIVPLRAVIVFRCLLHRVRRRLEHRANPKRMRRAAARVWLTAAGHRELEQETYLAVVLPMLERHEEESVRLYHKLRLELELILQPQGGDDFDELQQRTDLSSETAEKLAHCGKALDALDGLHVEAEDFVAKYNRSAASVDVMLGDVQQLRQNRKALIRKLLASLQHLGMVNHALSAALA